MHNDDKLSYFTSAITADGNAVADKVLSEIRTESEQQISAAEDEYLGETYRFIKNEVAQIRAEMRRNVSQKTLADKRALHSLRQSMFADVDAAVVAKLHDYTASEKYAAHIVDALQEASKAFYGEDITVYLRKDDMAMADELQASLPGVTLTFCEGEFRLGGLLCRCPSRRRQVDDTFDTRYAEMRERFDTLLG